MSYGSEGVIWIPQSSSITGAKPSDYLMSYPGHLLAVGGVLPICRFVVGVFYSPKQLGHFFGGGGWLSPLQTYTWCILQPQPAGPLILSGSSDIHLCDKLLIAVHTLHPHRNYTGMRRAVLNKSWLYGYLPSLVLSYLSKDATITGTTTPCLSGPGNRSTGLISSVR